MHLTLIILLFSVSTVFGDFEQILNRQYEPAIEAQSRMDWIWNSGVMKKNYDIVWLQLRDFTFYDINETEHEENYFIDEFLFKLNTSIPRITFDIQNMDRPKDLRSFAVGENNRKLHFDSIKAAVQWGGIYMIFEWSGSKDYFPLKNVRVTEKEPHILNRVYEDFARKTVISMMVNIDMFVIEFYYQPCEGERILDGKKVIAKKFLEYPNMLDVIHYYRNNGGEIAQHLVQFQIGSYNGRTHLFEVDIDTGKILKGMEHCCEVQEE